MAIQAMRFTLLLLFISIGFVTHANSELRVALPLHDTILLNKLTIKNLEKLSGRKFSLREKIEIKIFQQALKRKPETKKYKDADPGKQSTWSFILASAASILLIIGMANLIIGTLFLALIPALAIAALWLGIRSRKKIKNFKNKFGIIVGGGIILLGIIIGIVAIISL